MLLFFVDSHEMSLSLDREKITFRFAKAGMIFPNAVNDLLMFLASFRTRPCAPVLLTWH